MCRNCHDCTCSVAHQNVIRNENRDFLVIDWVDTTNTLQANARLFLCHFCPFKVRLSSCLFLICTDFIHIFQLVCPLFNQRMFRRNNHVSCTKQGIRTSGIDFQGITSSGLEVYFCTGRTSNPVPLCGLNLFQIIHFIQIIQQPLCIFCNLQHPLGFYFLYNFAAAAFANAANNFFICQNDLTGSTPVDSCFLLVCQTFLEHLQENPLCPMEIIRVSSVDFPIPVKGHTQCLQLRLKSCNIVCGYDCRMNLMLDGIVFSRQTECIPTHREQNIIAFHSPLSGNDIHCGIRSWVSDVQTLTRWVREFDQCIELRFCIIILCVERVMLRPIPLPLCFNGSKVIFAHSCFILFLVFS